MVRLLIGLVVVLLFFGGVMVADQTLQNPDLQPDEPDDAAQQEQLLEAVAPFISTVGPIALFALIGGLLLAGVRAFGGV